eukprot:8476511-Pyramimonas_sp.AAC.1
MVQIIAETQQIDRKVGDKEAILQAEATRIRADNVHHGDMDTADTETSRHAGLPGERLSRIEIEGIGRSIASRPTVEIHREAMNQIGRGLASTD